MKRFISVFIAIFVILAFTVPAMAADVGTSVNVLSGTGVPPIVKAKWETTATAPTSESGDPSHLTAGTQVQPNIGFQANTDVYFWAVVTDPAGVGNISHVYADVFYPATGTVDPGPNGSLKFEVELTQSATDEPTPTVLQNAYDAGLVTLGEGITLAEAKEELDQQSARLYRGLFHFDNCELAGDYPVTINAVNGQNVHGFLSNTLYWLKLTAAEFDFNAVNYGSVAIGVHKQIDGDRIWQTSTGANPATIRNIGNTYLRMTIKQDDMGLGKTQINGVDTWNVHYDARLGDGDKGGFANEGYINFDPAVVKGGNLAAAAVQTVPQILKLCSLEKIDFSITVDKDPSGTHAYSGLMILGASYHAGLPTNP